VTRFSLNIVTGNLPFQEPFRISGYTFKDWAVVVAEVSDGTHLGRGEACGVYYLGETAESMAAQIESVRGVIEAGISRQALRKLMPAGGARNAVDCALWELEARQLGRSVWQLAGLSQVRPLLTVYTLGADDPDAMVKAALVAADFPSLKLKLTGEAQLDVERVKAVRAARPDAWIGIDANQGYTAKTLPVILDCLERERVSLFEQPVARGGEAQLDGIRCPIPIAADESVLTVDEIAALVGRFDVVNIKLDKCGGLTEALMMIAEARRLGLLTMVGNMSGSSWATAAGYVVGQLCDFVDLDGPVHILEDRSPAVRYEHGYVICDDAVWGSRTGSV